MARAYLKTENSGEPAIAVDNKPGDPGEIIEVNLAAKASAKLALWDGQLKVGEMVLGGSFTRLAAAMRG